MTYQTRRNLHLADNSLWPLVVYFLAVVVLVLTILLLSWLIGQKSPNKPHAATGEPFESGVVPLGSSQTTISVEFYMVAMLFVIFDLETVFIFAWAVAFFELGLFGYLAIAVFITILTAALIYEWKSGALEWGVKTRRGAAAPGAPRRRATEVRMPSVGLPQVPPIQTAPGGGS